MEFQKFKTQFATPARSMSTHGELLHHDKYMYTWNVRRFIKRLPIKRYFSSFIGQLHEQATYI